jgi:hypothetical protein
MIRQTGLIAALERLRTKRRMRKGKTWSTEGQRRGQIVDAISIHQRPAHVEARKKPGHWEGDLVTGRRNTHIATLVERYSRYAILVRVDGKDSASVVGALVRKVNELPQGLFLSLTWDRGTELAMHKRFTAQTGVPVYFCDPKSPWQRGTNENTNGLVRQYIPPGLDLSTFSQHDQVPLPVPRHGPIFRFGRALADHDLGADELLAAPAGTGSWYAQRPTGPQARDQLASQCPATLNVKRSVNGLMRDPHRVIMGEVDPEPVGDLLGAPRHCPAPVLAGTVAPAVPAHGGTGQPGTVRGRDHSCQSVLHVVSQLLLRSQLRHLWAFGLAVGMPLRACRPILEPSTAGRGVAA